MATFLRLNGCNVELELDAQAWHILGVVEVVFRLGLGHSLIGGCF